MNPAAATIRAQRIVAIIRRSDGASAVAAGRHLLQAGLRAVEVSLTTPNAIDAIASLAAEAPAGSCVGAGTVIEASQVAAVAKAGATFIVSPVLDPEVLAAARHLALACLPGAATPTEALTAHRLGADLVKLFPATAWMPDTLADVLRALPFLPLVPTGGVTPQTAPRWIAAGAAAVGVGSALHEDCDIPTLLRRLAG